MIRFYIRYILKHLTYIQISPSSPFTLSVNRQQMKLRLLKQSMVGIGPRTTQVLVHLCNNLRFCFFHWENNEALFFSRKLFSEAHRMGGYINVQIREVVNHSRDKNTLSWYAIINLISQYHPVCMTKHSLGSKQLLLLYWMVYT